MSGPFVCAVDVGTASARAGIFDRSGALLGRADHPIRVHQPAAGFAEHDSDDIWTAVCAAVRAARRQAAVSEQAIVGIGFDATCSLVVRGRDGEKVSVAIDGNPSWDTISWFDHRSMAEADECTAGRHNVLNYVGGVMSPEMQMPKLMWLKRNRPVEWDAAANTFDLADFLTWRATGSRARSQCTLTCKWGYLPQSGGWQDDFLEQVGLDDLLERGGLPREATPVGAAVGGLSDDAASDLGLAVGTPVSSGLIDAYAGMLGAIGHHAGNGLERHLALIAGTSSCVMAFSREPRFVPSLWGPYVGAALPGLWAVEGGQSATGGLLDHIIRTHSQGGDPTAQRHGAIVQRVQQLRSGDAAFGSDLHVLPDFHGNRSPLADPHARGVISGLDLDGSFDGLCKLYWRTCVSIALGVRHVLDHMNGSGYQLDRLHVTGGHTRNALLMELYADATGATVVESETDDAVLLGSAMTAAASCGLYSDLTEACREMAAPERTRQPDATDRAAYARDYAVFQAMHRHRSEIAGLQQR